jgi:mannose-6-phosphate isomerase-like protein (cupin superfamily)
MSITRRDLSLLIPALAAAQTASAQTPAPKTPGKEKPVLPAKAYEYTELTVKTSGPNGANEGRAVFDGLTHSGYPVELHMTKLGVGQSPHPPHKHINEEVLMLRSGQLDAFFGGATHRITAGSTIYMASMEEHGWKNPGPETAEYFVIALGPKA